MREDARDATAETMRATVDEAARLLGTTDGAIRKRIHRGTLEAEKGDDGRVYVYLNREATEDYRDDHRDDADPLSEVRAVHLLDAKDETIAVLREQLEAERRAHGETRRIVAGLVQRVPELEAAPGEAARQEEIHESPGETVEGESAPEPEKETSREKNWWSRIFGG